MPTTLKPSELQTDQILLKITLGVTHPPGEARADHPPWVCAALPRSGTESPLPTAGLQGRGWGQDFGSQHRRAAHRCGWAEGVRPPLPGTAEAAPKCKRAAPGSPDLKAGAAPGPRVTERSAGGQLALEVTRVPWERCLCPKDSTRGVLPAVLAWKGQGKSASTAPRAHQRCWEPLALSILCLQKLAGKATSRTG